MFRTNNLSICRVCCKILLFGVAFQLLSFTSDIIYRIRKYAKLLKDKRFELENLTGAVEKYSSLVNGEQVEISLFCTRHLIGSI